MNGISEKQEGAILCLCGIVLCVCILALSYKMTYEIHSHFHNKLHAEMKEGAK